MPSTTFYRNCTFFMLVDARAFAARAVGGGVRGAVARAVRSRKKGFPTAVEDRRRRRARGRGGRPSGGERRAMIVFDE